MFREILQMASTSRDLRGAYFEWESVQKSEYVLVLIISSYFAKARLLTTVQYSPAAYFINDHGWFVVPSWWYTTITVIKTGMYCWPRFFSFALRRVL